MNERPWGDEVVDLMPRKPKKKPHDEVVAIAKRRRRRPGTHAGERLESEDFANALTGSIPNRFNKIKW